MTDHADKKIFLWEDETEYYSEEFINLNLAGNKFKNKEFDDCAFEDCDFTKSVFNDCKFRDCRFVNSNLSIVNVKLSKFSEVVFENCKVIGVDWTRADWSGTTFGSHIQFHKSILNDSTFLGLHLKELVIEACQAHDVDFRDGHFKDANFTDTDFLNALFNNTDLTNSNFAGATNYLIDIYQNVIKRAKFSRFEAIRLLDSLGIELVD